MVTMMPRSEKAIQAEMDEEKEKDRPSPERMQKLYLEREVAQEREFKKFLRKHKKGN